MKISTKFKEICSYQGNNFLEWFGDMEYVNNTNKIYSKTLTKRMNDKEIMAEFKPSEVTLGDVFNYLKEAGTSLRGIFYVRDDAGVLRTVGVFWGGVGWFVDAFSFEGPDRWDGGYRVFSRNSFETQSLSPSESLTLGHFAHCPHCGTELEIIEYTSAAVQSVSFWR